MLGVQVLALVYRSGEAWNAAGRSDESFDQNLDEALESVHKVHVCFKRRTMILIMAR